jgi:hypothetical protein
MSKDVNYEGKDWALKNFDGKPFTLVGRFRLESYAEEEAQELQVKGYKTHIENQGSDGGYYPFVLWKRK